MVDQDEVIPDDAIRGYTPGRSVIVFRGSANRPVVVPQEVAEDAEKIYRCHVKHLSGKSWKQVAREEGFPDMYSCRSAVERYLAEGRAMVEQYTGKQMLLNEVMLLDYMQSRLWSSVEAGDLKAIDQVLKISTKRVEWQNLAVKDDARATDVHTVVIAGEAYTEYLKNAAAQAQIAASTDEGNEQAVTSTVASATTQEES